MSSKNIEVESEYKNGAHKANKTTNAMSNGRARFAFDYIEIQLAHDNARYTG